MADARPSEQQDARPSEQQDARPSEQQDSRPSEQQDARTSEEQEPRYSEQQEEPPPEPDYDNRQSDLTSEVDLFDGVLEDEESQERRRKKKRFGMGIHGLLECSISFTKPPKNLQYGELVNRTIYHPTRRRSLAFGIDAKPKHVELPFLRNSMESRRIVEADADTHNGAGNIMGRIAATKDTLTYPAWLIELSDYQHDTILEMRVALKKKKFICELVPDLYTATQDLAVDVSKKEIVKILRRIPIDDNGYFSFPHFMMAMGNPLYARQQGIFLDPIEYDEDDCKEKATDAAFAELAAHQAEEEEEEGADADADNAEELQKKRKSSLHKRKSQKPYRYSQTATTNRLYKPYQLAETDTWPMNQEQYLAFKSQPPAPKYTKAGKDRTVYSDREQVFYTGLLIFEMYHTIKKVEKLYFQNETVPVPETDASGEMSRRGFGVETIGTKKLKWAEWDRPLPPIPTRSPYKSKLPFVAKRWKINRPNALERKKRRTLTELQNLYLAVYPPDKPNGKIKIKENVGRVQKVMNLLASQGEVLAKLPLAYTTVHLSDTFIQRLEHITVHAMPNGPPPAIRPFNDFVEITHDVQQLLLLHGLPPKIDRMSHVIDYSTAICLRNSIRKIQQEHWASICEKRLEYRDKMWSIMHVEQIPCVHRDGFTYTFDAYLPYNAYLPVVTNNTPLNIGFMYM